MSGIDTSDPCRAVSEAADVLRMRWNCVPDVAVVAGSGLSVLRTLGRLIDSVRYSELPGLTTSTVAGHDSELCLLQCGSSRVALFTGRVHLYEGHAASVVAQQLALTHLLGCSSVVLTNASGGLNPARSVGDVVVVSDIINWSLRSISRQPLHDHRLNGPVLDDRWQHAILSASTLAGVQLNRGVIAQMLGPSYETRAEIRMLRKCGADLVGMSSGVEARWASSIGMRVAMISLVTNTLTDTTVRTVSHDEVLEAGRSAEARVCIAVRCAIESLPLSV